MGIKNMKADSVAADARRAKNEGHSVFVVQLRAGVSMTASGTRTVPGFAEVMESVEALGWVLDKSTFIIHNDKPTAYLIYRRTVTPAETVHTAEIIQARAPEVKVQGQLHPGTSRACGSWCRSDHHT